MNTGAALSQSYHFFLPFVDQASLELELIHLPLALELLGFLAWFGFFEIASIVAQSGFRLRAERLALHS